MHATEAPNRLAECNVLLGPAAFVIKARSKTRIAIPAVHNILRARYSVRALHNNTSYWPRNSRFSGSLQLEPSAPAFWNSRTATPPACPNFPNLPEQTLAPVFFAQFPPFHPGAQKYECLSSFVPAAIRVVRKATSTSTEYGALHIELMEYYSLAQFPDSACSPQYSVQVSIPFGHGVTGCASISR